MTLHRLLSPLLLLLLLGCTHQEHVFSCIAEACETNNKTLVMRIYTELMNKNQANLVEELFDSKLVIHSATHKGFEGEKAFLHTLKTNNPSYIATVKHIAAEGNYVAVHWHLSSTPTNEFSGQVVVDLYRLSHQKIVEHWYLSRQLMEKTTSGNSVFSDLYQYKSTKPITTQASEADNKSLVTSAYLGLFNQNNLELIDLFFVPDYIQHNPFVPNGREALRSFVKTLPPGNLGFFVTIADDDLVWTFSGEADLKLVDIFRVDNKKIVEHYDVF
jgi:predicted SnoaL-like aldol condensation-catalyzing enzyme